jgi:predicted phage tail protein
MQQNHVIAAEHEASVVLTAALIAVCIFASAGWQLHVWFQGLIHDMIMPVGMAVLAMDGVAKTVVKLA